MTDEKERIGFLSKDAEMKIGDDPQIYTPSGDFFTPKFESKPDFIIGLDLMRKVDMILNIKDQSIIKEYKHLLSSEDGKISLTFTQGDMETIYENVSFKYWWNFDTIIVKWVEGNGEDDCHSGEFIIKRK